MSFKFTCTLYQFFVLFFFFNDTATTEIYTLSLHDALPILQRPDVVRGDRPVAGEGDRGSVRLGRGLGLPPPEQQRGAQEEQRSEEHTSELQSRQYLVCRLLLEKKKKRIHIILKQQQERTQT